MFNSDKFVYFVNVRPGRRPYGFSTYMDAEGKVQMIVNGYDSKTGEPIPRQINFSRKEWSLRIPINQKDKEGKSVVEFLRNHPECEGSPNNEGQPILFKEINYSKDADIANQAKAKRIKAESIALNLELEELQEIASSFGVIINDSNPEGLLRHKMLELAGNDPETFLEGYNAPDRLYKALINKGVKAGLLSRKGEMIMWESTVIGTSLSSAISTLAEDKKLTKSIEEAIKRLN
jgi:hypothetical protein